MTFRLHPYVSTVTTDTGLVILNERTGAYFEVNSTGANALAALLNGASQEETARRLTAGTGTTPAQGAADVTAFLTSLARRGLGTFM